MMQDVHAVINRLDRFLAAGIRVAIDDFGTGFSSLSNLRELPLDTLKIDRAFMRSNCVEHIDYQLVNTNFMARGLGLKTIAEGVETEAQLNQLVELGCNLMQGYLLARPALASELPALIATIEDRLLLIDGNACPDFEIGAG